MHKVWILKYITGVILVVILILLTVSINCFITGNVLNEPKLINISQILMIVIPVFSLIMIVVKIFYDKAAKNNKPKD